MSNPTNSDCVRPVSYTHLDVYKRQEYLRIVEWAAADVDPDPAQLGLQGSPTKVKRIENVVFAAKEAKKLTAADNDINELMVELIASHTLG